MKDGSDVTTVCSHDGRTFLSVLSTMDNGFSESRSLGLHKDCDAANSPEATNTWGDFESFNEFPPQADQLLYEDEPIEEDILVTTTPEGDCCTHQTDREVQWNAFNLGNEENLSSDTETTAKEGASNNPKNRQECEQIFRSGFPAVPVEDTNEDVKSLEEMMSSNEENISQLIKTRLWLEGDLSWQGGDGMSTRSGCEWQNSKGCRDLMTLLGSVTENSSNNGGKADDSLMDIEQLYFNESAPPGGNTNLIQTKLDVAPGSKTGYISSYQLVLKKSSDVPFLTFSGKKSFFSANQLRFNF